MHVWDDDGGFLSFPPGEADGDGVMFHVVENDLMVHSLGEGLKKCDGNVVVSYGKGVRGVELKTDGVRVTLGSQDGEEVYSSNMRSIARGSLKKSCTMAPT